MVIFHSKLLVYRRKGKIYVHIIWEFPYMGVPQIDGLFHGISQSKMDDDWGYPYFRKPHCSNPWKWWSSWKPGSCWARITNNILETLFYLFWGCYTLISTCPDLSCARRALQCANAARKVCLGESLGHGVHEMNCPELGRKLSNTWVIFWYTQW